MKDVSSLECVLISAHWNEFGATISDIPATVAVRPLVVIDISPKVASNPSYAATAADVLHWEAQYGRISEGSVVFIRSDWSLRWEEYALNGTPDVIPGVSLEALRLLHLGRGILFHGSLHPLTCHFSYWALILPGLSL